MGLTMTPRRTQEKPGFIFGGDTGVDYQALQRRRAIADAMRARSLGNAPRNVGEGLTAIGQALAGRYLDKKLAPKEDAARKSASDVLSSLMGGGTNYRDAIASIESAGSGDYSAVGPETDGDRAYGRYQVMGKNIPQWTREILGTEMTPEEFLADPKSQDAVFDGKFGGYVDQYGNPQDAASAWFTGRPRAQGGNATDVLGTSGNEYVDKFNSALGGPNTQQIMQAITQLSGNPYAPPGADAVLQALLGQSMQKPETMTPYQREQIRLREQEMKMREAGTYAPGTNVTTNVGGSAPAPAQGYRNVFDDAGNLIRQEVIPGGPRDTTAEDQKAQENKETSANIVLDEINIARDLINTADWPTTGIAGGVLSVVDSTSAGRVKNRLDTIKANIGFDKLQAMRDASPTGGALGQVSEFENRLLQAVFGSLVQAQTKKDLLYNLGRIESIYDRIINKGIPDDEARRLYREIAVGEDSVGDDGYTVEEVK